MFPVDQAEISTLQTGNIPESLDPELLSDIQFALYYNGEATIVFYPSDDCTYAALLEGDLFNDWEEEGRVTLKG
jgi:hypothetical protein